MRTTLAILAVVVSGLVAAPVAASAAPLAPITTSARGYNKNNVATVPFVKTMYGVTLIYTCERASGDISNTRVQLVNEAQTVAYRDFAAVCDGEIHNLGSLNAPSNTVMRARIHTYTAGTVDVDLAAVYTGREA
jgi:hypothetical protein